MLAAFISSNIIVVVVNAVLTVAQRRHSAAPAATPATIIILLLLVVLFIAGGAYVQCMDSVGTSIQRNVIANHQPAKNHQHRSSSRSSSDPHASLAVGGISV